MSKDKSHGETKSHVDTKSKPELKRKASHEVQLALVRGDEMYQKRREELLRGTALPGEGFPEAMYTDNWFREREHDLTSDEDVYKMGEDADDEDLGDEGDDFGGADWRKLVLVHIRRDYEYLYRCVAKHCCTFP